MNGGEKGSTAFTQFYMRKSRKEEVLEEVMEEVKSWNCRANKRDEAK